MKILQIMISEVLFRERSKVAAILFFFLFISIQNAKGQFEEVSPKSQGFSPERLQKIDSLIQSYTGDSRKIAGTVALVARHGKIIYYKSFGYKDIEEEREMKIDDLFRIASQTKAVTGVAVMILYEEGKFLLDDPVSKYIPEFGEMEVLDTFNKKDTTYTTVKAKREITIRDLLTHTSGISYPIIGNEEARAIYSKLDVPVGFEPRNITLEEGMRRLAKAPLMHQPGKKFTYGLSIDLLGYLVEKVSGLSFKDFLHQRLFEPLEMKDTYFYVPKEKHSRLSKVYKRDKKGNKVENKSSDSAGLNVIYPLVENGRYYSGGAGLVSTAYDYAVFLQMLANGGEYAGKRILAPSTVNLMTMNQINREETERLSEDDFGLTFKIVTDAGEGKSFPWPAGTFEWGGFWGSSFWVDPKSDIVGQIWTQDQGASYGEMAKRFFVMVYGALVEP